MFGIGMSEMIIICVVALLVFGPDELPRVVKKIARGIGEARRVTDDLRRSIDLVDEGEEDRRARAFARSPMASASSAPGADGAGGGIEPETIPGSLLTPAHGEDAPVVAAPAGNVALGAGLVDTDDVRDAPPGLEPPGRPDAPVPASAATNDRTPGTDTAAHGVDADDRGANEPTMAGR